MSVNKIWSRSTIEGDRRALWPRINPCVSSAGNSVGGLRAYGPQVLHGNGPDPAGGPGPVGHRQRLVQVVPYLLSGRPQHRPAHQTPLAVLAGERHQPLLHLDDPAPRPLQPPGSQQAPPTCKHGHTYCKYTAAVFEFAGRVRSVRASRSSRERDAKKKEKPQIHRHAAASSGGGKKKSGFFFFPDQANST